MLETLLLLIGKGLITGAASKGGQILVDNLKEYFGTSLGEKIGDAYVRASEEYTKSIGEEIEFNYLGDKPYYENLLYSFNIIDGNNLSDYYKQMSKLFLIEIFKTPELANQVFNIKLDNIQKDLTTLKNNFVGNLSSYTRDKFISEKDLSDFPTYYISRKLIPNTDFFTERRISSFNKFIEYAQNSTNDNKSTAIRALILADGGIGKSVYLKYLAKDCLRNNQLYPVFISLRDLKSTDILQEYIKRRFPDLKKIDTKEYNQLCFFLDGFDEIGDSSAAIKQIGDLCSTYLESHIILTSRRNSFFSDLPDFPNHLIFTLLDLNQKDIETYIHANYTAYKIDTNHFFEEVFDNNFRNLIYNPFYLKALIDCYIKGGNSLKISKKDLIDSLIAQRREKDKTKRPDLELDKPTTKLKTSKLAKQFALTQALMDQRSLSDSNTATLFGDDFDLAINSLPIRKGSIVDNEQQWEFEHNIFLEHIVSDILKNLTIEQILEYGSSNSKIKSKWRDIISHLLGILDNTHTRRKTVQPINKLAYKKRPGDIVRDRRESIIARNAL